MEKAKALKIFLVAAAVLVLAGLVVIAVMKMRQAEERQKQLETMTRIRSLYDAWGLYQNYFGTYCPKGKENLEFAWGNISPDELKEMLSPFILMQWDPKKTFLDGWDHPLQFAAVCHVPCDPMYWTRKPGSLVCDVYIRSAGRDGKWDRGDHYEKKATPPNAFDADIVWEKGQFVQSPAAGK